MKVIASSGSDAKVEYMRSLGADFSFNYKTTSYSDALAKHGPIHVFWVQSTLSLRKHVAKIHLGRTTSVPKL